MAGSDAADGDLTTLIVPATPTLIESVAPTIGPDAPLTPPEQMPPSPLYRVHYAAECFRAWVQYAGGAVISDTLFYGVKAGGFEEKLYMVCAHDCGFFEMCEYVGCRYTFEYAWCCDCNAPMQTDAGRECNAPTLHSGAGRIRHTGDHRGAKRIQSNDTD